MINKSSSPGNTYLFGLGLALANCTIAVPSLFSENNYALFRWEGYFSLVIFIVLVFLKSNNILFLARTLFLGGIGYYAVAVKIFAGPTALFSLYEASTQGMNIVVVMYVATSLALLGNETGLMVGSCNSKKLVLSNSRQSGLWPVSYTHLTLPTKRIV